MGDALGLSAPITLSTTYLVSVRVLVPVESASGRLDDREIQVYEQRVTDLDVSDLVVWINSRQS